jgi:hypothetical protein
MTDVKKSRTILFNELRGYFGLGSFLRIYFSQDEEYLIMASDTRRVYIIRIGSLSEFFSGSPIDVKAVLQLEKLYIETEIIGVHMSR